MKTQEGNGIIAVIEEEIKAEGNNLNYSDENYSDDYNDDTEHSDGQYPDMYPDW